MANFGTVLSSPAALAGLSLMVLICLGNQLVNVVFGVWLNESFAFQITALGGASAVIGISELIGEGGVSLISDRLSKKKAVLVGLLGSSLSAAVLPFLGRTRTGAVIGLFLFYLSFEFTIVSVIPLMTGVVPEARATLMALNIASASLGRGMGSLIAAPIYNVGFPLTAALTAGVNLLALIALRYVFVKEKG
jgi:predicted MFS family arabinose efflux permease